ncbi:phage tail tape measure protein [Micromonospora sp. NPDC005652]|uniref:phage tail tape measure protein n=1 Tax=Micromonospora sp. NPDC005652 TaxID=3157046 RepID=UPI0033C6F997
MSTVLRTAYVEVLPSLDRFPGELTRRLRGISVDREGNQLGGSFGDGFTRGVDGKLRDANGRFVKVGKGFGDNMADGASASFSGGFLKSLSTLAVAAAGGAIGAALGGAITSALDVGAANDKLRAQLRLSKDESARLGKLAGELYSSNYGASMGDVNDAISSVITNIKSMRTASEPELKAVTAGALDIVRVFGQDMPGVTSAVSSMLQSGLAPNAKAALDIITTGFQEGLDKGGDFLDTLTEYSGQFRKLGLGGKESLGIINQLLAGGARNSDLAADAIKEFSIRSIDGSKSTAEGFKLLRLDADKMAASIAAGGPKAKEAFGTVVDRLNAMQDPVKRNTAGVALFGTQWEDLGAAFRNLDVKAATDDISKLGGATKNIADQSDQGRLNSFIRTLKQGFVNTVGGEVLPRAQQLIDKLKANQGFMDGLRSAGDRLKSTFSAVATGAGNVIGWLRQHETTTKTLAVAVGALVIATKAHAAALALQAAGGLASYIKQIRVVQAVTRAWAAVQWLINAAMAANPVTLIIIGLFALGAALVVAYKKSETFRNIVQGAWKGIQEAAKFAWEKVIKPAMDAMVGFFKNTLAPAFQWLYNNVIKPVWSGIQTAVSVAWTVIKAVFNGIKAYIDNVVIPVFKFLYNNVIKPVWAGIQWAIKAAWVVIQIIFAAIKLYLTNVIFPVFRFLYNNVIKPVWAGIQQAISNAWNNIKTIFNLMKAYLNNVVFPVYRWLYNNVIKPVFNGISTTISTVWNKGIKPIFQALGGFIKDKVAPGFRTGVSAIASAWDKVKDAASAPVRFIVDTVLNKGLIGGINWLASKVGVKDRIPPITWGGLGGGSKGSKPRGDKISGNTRGDGYGHGVGDGHGIGDGLGSLLTSPAKWLADRVGLGRIVGKFGSNPFVKTISGAAGKAKDFALEKVRSLAGSLLGSASGNGGSVGAGGLRSGILGALGALRGQFGGVPLISGLRPGSITTTGNRSYHASGRAIDIAPVRAWAEYLNRTYGPQLRELITPWQDLNLHNGRPHRYTGSVWQTHNFAGGNAHIHAAMANGGVIREPVFGIGASGRTYSFGEGYRPEAVVPLRGGAGAGGGNEYHISVQVAPGGNPAETGRKIVEAIKAFEANSGARWRTR